MKERIKLWTRNASKNITEKKNDNQHAIRENTSNIMEERGYEM